MSTNDLACKFFLSEPEVCAQRVCGILVIDSRNLTAGQDNLDYLPEPYREVSVLK